MNRLRWDNIKPWIAYTLAIIGIITGTIAALHIGVLFITLLVEWFQKSTFAGIAILIIISAACIYAAFRIYPED